MLRRFFWGTLTCALLLAKETGSPSFEGDYTLVATAKSEGGGYFAGAASSDLALIAIGGYVSSDANVKANERELTFFDADGKVLKKVNIGNGTWSVAMTPDGKKTAAGSDDENLYLFEGTTLVASGRPLASNLQIRGVAISEDGRYVGSGGAKFTLHDLTSSTPLTPIYTDTTLGACRTVDFASKGR